MLLRPPGVYPAQGDTWLLADAVRRVPLPDGATVLDLGTGTGALAVVAARRGATVTAVDVSRTAVAAAWLNTRCRGLGVRVHHGDLGQPVAAERFDLIVSNPPYVPSERAALPRRGLRRAWDAGVDGRAFLNRLCTEIPRLLAPGGQLLLVQSTLCGVQDTLNALVAAGLDAEVMARREQPFGPVLRLRANLLEARSIIRPAQRQEELVVIRGSRRD